MFRKYRFFWINVIRSSFRCKINLNKNLFFMSCSENLCRDNDDSDDEETGQYRGYRFQKVMMSCVFHTHIHISDPV